MTGAQQRRRQRAVHLVSGAMLLVFVYGPDIGHFHTFVQVVALPVLVLTGVVMWQAPRIRRLRKRMTAARETGSQ